MKIFFNFAVVVHLMVEFIVNGFGFAMLIFLLFVINGIYG